ncbi:MAG: class I SAM-dependent methyltransferase [Chitinophagaceae bacterium]|nr:class I SAM-dependent methyltransferase [Chitinophagaceae bacterium]
MLPDKLPFYFKAHPQKGNGGQPDSLPFDVYYDDELCIYRQTASEQLKNKLNEVYELGSLVDGSISNESGKVYVELVTDFILQSLPIKQTNESLSVLEVGCGNGIILKQLKKKDSSLKLTGIEPGGHGIVEGIDDEIDIIRDFFPAKQIASLQFDLIYSLLVLEHIEDPVVFLQQQKNQLTQSGKLIFGVPNCEPFIETGAISIFIHEHYLYFTRKGYLLCWKKAGLFLERIEIIEGMFLVTSSTQKTPYTVTNDKTESISYQDFEQLSDSLNHAIEKLFEKYAQEEVAIYVPGRALNTLFLLNILKCRLIDDNTEISGKYLPCLHNAIEPFSEMIKNPPKCILIYSRTFGDKIKNKCMQESALAGTEILTLNDIA